MFSPKAPPRASTARFFALRRIPSLRPCSAGRGRVKKMGRLGVSARRQALNLVTYHLGCFHTCAGRFAPVLQARWFVQCFRSDRLLWSGHVTIHLWSRPRSWFARGSLEASHVRGSSSEESSERATSNSFIAGSGYLVATMTAGRPPSFHGHGHLVDSEIA